MPFRQEPFETSVLENEEIQNNNHVMENNNDEGQLSFRRNEEEYNQHEEDDRVPLLFVDVNLGQGRAERITVYEGDTAESLAQRFAEEHSKINSLNIPKSYIRFRQVYERKIKGTVRCSNCRIIK